MVHGDLKSSMILLDDKYNPMIFNVGLSQLMPVTPRFRNNCAPEFLESANATAETDVYSNARDLTKESTYKGIHPVDLPTWVRSVPTEKWFKEVLFDMKQIEDNINNRNVLVKIIRLALQCVEYDPKARPTVQDVLCTLEQIEV
ncbi:probably inactive leucine-rich repeat receptor-like protein kinase IMK2 [Bidens hawaiensis]|uniref:probably inactive leucine-rich repeat receptor-like protein kinase IMK2 n=1 Tax=Bidens hawaiensis TaxID=980011 RepID=UPI00404A6573